ncbi:MAG TPA: hypothetical protein VFU69_06555 [Ktedonobacterales bacterium]|nr:hypothetical protein [Ktedonobacterales bacterium]
MQQFCNSCGSPITAGMTNCARCGAPVSSSGPGAYDPTVRAGSPPGTGYGSQPYGPSSNDPYAAPPPPPYGASQPQPGFGAPPPPPGFGPPPQPGFGAPQQPYMAPPPQPKKSRAWIYIVGAILVVLILVCGGIAFAINSFGHAVSSAVNNLSTQVATITVTTGAHVSNVQIGKGDDQGNITSKTSSFSESDTIDIVFTVTTQDSGAHVTLQILDSSGSELQTDFTPLPVETGTHDYYFAFSITGADSYTANLQYNGATEQAVDFTVS